MHSFCAYWILCLEDLGSCYMPRCKVVALIHGACKDQKSPLISHSIQGALNKICKVLESTVDMVQHAHQRQKGLGPRVIFIHFTALILQPSPSHKTFISTTLSRACKHAEQLLSDVSGNAGDAAVLLANSHFCGTSPKRSQKVETY